MHRTDTDDHHEIEAVKKRYRSAPADGPANGTRGSSGAQVLRQQDRKKRQAEKQSRKEQRAESRVVKLQVDREELMKGFTDRKTREESSTSEFES